MGSTREAPEKWPNKHFDSVNVSGPLGHAQTLVNGEKSFILIFFLFPFLFKSWPHTGRGLGGSPLRTYRSPHRERRTILV